MKKVLKVLGVIVVIILLAVTGLLVYVKTALPNVGPAPDLKVDATPERIKHGEYLANHVTLCIDCHSTRNEKLWSGPVVPGTAGQGGQKFETYYSKNLTPYHLGDWTDGEIYRAITAGVSKDGMALFPIMQYLHFGKMDPEDIKDIIAYIRTLPAIKNDVNESTAEFPMNFIINTIPEKAAPGTRPSSSDLVAYGGYMVNASGCLECHSKRENGKLVGELFAGGFEFDLGAGTATSANITPHKETGIGDWTETAFLAKFKRYADSSYQDLEVKSGEPQTVMPWTQFSGMETNDLKAIYAYLRTVKPVNNKIEKWKAKQPVAKL
jgi:mono/diheme cytochrome c family protein